MSRAAPDRHPEQLVLKLEEPVAVEARPAPFASQSIPPVMEAPAVPDLAAMALRLQEVDRHLGTRHVPPVEIRTRRNRSTMGSLRLDRRASPVWRFTVAEDLLRNHPGLVLDLACLLLHRARRKAAPPALVESLARLRALWATRDAPPRDSARRLTGESDGELTLRLRMVATILGHLPTLPLPDIVWVKSHSLRVMGRYHSRTRRIEIHAALRQENVPKYVIDNLLAHEILHFLLGPKRHGSRLVHHHAEFRLKERAFPGFALAEAWSKEKWPRLVSRFVKNLG